jgi:hypothetical protein
MFVTISAVTESGSTYTFKVERADEVVEFKRSSPRPHILNVENGEYAPVNDDYIPRLPVIQNGRSILIERFGGLPPITTTPVVWVVVSTEGV